MQVLCKLWTRNFIVDLETFFLGQQWNTSLVEYIHKWLLQEFNRLYDLWIKCKDQHAHKRVDYAGVNTILYGFLYVFFLHYPWVMLPPSTLKWCNICSVLVICIHSSRVHTVTNPAVFSSRCGIRISLYVVLLISPSHCSVRNSRVPLSKPVQSILYRVLITPQQYRIWIFSSYHLRTEDA